MGLERLVQADLELSFLRDNPFLDSYLRPVEESCLICSYQLQRDCLSHSARTDDDDDVEDNDTTEDTNSTKNRLLVYFVTTAPENWENRKVIRATWAPVANPRPVFITGKELKPKA